MRFRSPLCWPGWLLLSLGFGMSTAADAAGETKPALPFLSPIFGEHMVLQRDKPNPLWGWTQPGQTVSIEIAGQKASATAGADGKWSVTIAVPPAGGPYTLTISGPETLELHDVLVGDVWLCGGQSNMFLALRDSAHGAEVAQTAQFPWLRLCTVAGRNAYLPAVVPQCEWKPCTPENAAGFSAVAFYFARRLEAGVNVPIGLIQDCVGGSPAEAWMSAKSLASLGEFSPQIAEIQELSRRSGPQYGSFLMHWLDDYDVGGRGEAWAKMDFDDSSWIPVQLPGGFAELGDAVARSVCWFRREVVLPASLPSGAGHIYLGEIEKMDTTYVNGHWIGASSWVENPRVYSIPAGTLRPGRNVIAVRVFRTKADGGFRAAPDGLRLELADGTRVPLAGRWLGRLSVDARPPHAWPLDVENYPTMPTTLANGMIAPLAPLALTGAIWYQGEANTAHAQQYRKLLPALIQDWRAQFAQGDFPFYIVSLPAFMSRRSSPGSDGWAEVREVQADTARTVPHAGLAVTLDAGEADNLHPKDKKTVGERLALVALAEHYGQAVVASGPVFSAMEKKSGELRLKFTNIADGLVIRGTELGEFAVAGADHRWHWAKARIVGDTVVVSSPEVPDPVAARYAWQGNPLATLFNTAGLPAIPFRTDDWPL